MIEKFAVLTQKLTQRPRKSRTFLLGIDGPGGSGKTRFADLLTETLADYHVVPAEGFVLVEGVFALRQETWPFYDFGIWIDCARKIRLERGLARGGICRPLQQNMMNGTPSIFFGVSSLQ